MATKTQLKTPQGKKPHKTTQAIIRLHEKHPTMTLEDIGKNVGREKSTVCRTLKRYKIEKKRAKAFIQNRADILAGTQEKIIENLNKNIDTIPIKTSQDMKNITIGFGILDERERLARGQATQNVALAGVVEIVDRDKRKNDE